MKEIQLLPWQPLAGHLPHHSSCTVPAPGAEQSRAEQSRGVSEQSFPTGDDREGVCVQSSEEEGPAVSIRREEVAWEKEGSHKNG